MTTADKQRTVTLTDRPPVKISEAAWPVIAKASDHDNQYEVQANNLWHITVREHDDGRRIVYGRKSAGPGGQRIGTRNPAAGYLLAAGADASETIEAIKRVATAIDRDDMGAQCIADLPAEELT